jgi:hypothetical protein
MRCQEWRCGLIKVHVFKLFAVSYRVFMRLNGREDEVLLGTLESGTKENFDLWVRRMLLVHASWSWPCKDSHHYPVPHKLKQIDS